jgi:hypothetical protein
MTTFSVSDSRLPQPGGSGLHIYIPQEQGGTVIPPDTRFPFHPHYIALTRTAQKKIFSIFVCLLVAGETKCPQSCSFATAVILSPVYIAVTWQWVYVSQHIQVS